MIPLWLVVVIACVALYLGIALGLRIARREREERADTRLVGPGMPTEEEEADELRKRGWL